MANEQDKFHDRFKDAQAMSAFLDGQWREEWQFADEVIAALVTRDDLKIVDLGAGTGYFTSRLAKALPKGKIHAIDPVPSMIDWINQKIIPEDDLKNVTTGLVTFEDPKLREVPFEMDVLLISYTYHHIGGAQDARVAYMRDMVRPSLPPDVLVVFVDLEDVPPDMPEHLSSELGHGDHHHHGSPEHPDFVTPEELKKEMDAAGFTFVTDYGYDHKPSYMLAFKLKT